MKKILIVLVIYSSFITLSVLSAIVKMPTANAQSPSCTISTSPTIGFTNETKFDISGTVNIPGGLNVSRIDIVDESKQISIGNITSKNFSTLTKTSFSVNEFGPFLNEGKYHLNLVVSSTTRGGQRVLCRSNTIEIMPLPTPTPGGPTITPSLTLTCNPPGRNPNNVSKCADSNCRPVGATRGVTVNSPCEPFGVILPTPVPPTPESSLPPCSQWANLQGTPIPIQQTKNRENIKCIAVDTAIGVISTQPQGFVKRIFSLVLGIAGGIALILIILSGYKMMASQGNPEALSAAREQLVSAIIGLLFIILSFVILQIIGVDILQIPGFSL